MRHCQPLGPFMQSCSAAGGWIREPPIQPMGEYSALRGNEPSRHEKTRRDRERGSLSDRSRSEKAASCAIPATGLSGEGTTVVAVTGPWLQGRGDERVDHGFRAVKTSRMTLEWWIHAAIRLCKATNIRHRHLGGNDV